MIAYVCVRVCVCVCTLLSLAPPRWSRAWQAWRSAPRPRATTRRRSRSSRPLAKVSTRRSTARRSSSRSSPQVEREMHSRGHLSKATCNVVRCTGRQSSRLVPAKTFAFFFSSTVGWLSLVRRCGAGVPASAPARVAPVSRCQRHDRGCHQRSGQPRCA